MCGMFCASAMIDPEKSDEQRTREKRKEIWRITVSLFFYFIFFFLWTPGPPGPNYSSIWVYGVQKYRVSSCVCPLLSREIMKCIDTQISNQIQMFFFSTHLKQHDIITYFSLYPRLERDPRHVRTFFACYSLIRKNTQENDEITTPPPSFFADRFPHNEIKIIFLLVF